MSRARSTSDVASPESSTSVETVTAVVESTAPAEQIAVKRPSETVSRRTAILFALADKVARNERLPRRITLADEEISTADFLASFKFDRRHANAAALQRIAPTAIPNASVCEVVAVIGFYFESQISKAQAARTKIERANTFAQPAAHN